MQEEQCELLGVRLEERYSLFDALSNKEKQRRSDIYINFNADKIKENITDKIITEINKAPLFAKYIPIDLRYYDTVNLNDYLFSALPDDKLDEYLPVSKFDQGFFILVNRNSNGIKIKAGKHVKNFKQEIFIKRPDLRYAEFVFNVSNSLHVVSNLKFGQDQIFSIIADNVERLGLDLREATNMQYNINQKWMMKLYSISNSTITNGKITTGFINYVNNIGTESIAIDKLDKSYAACYAMPEPLLVD